MTNPLSSKAVSKPGVHEGKRQPFLFESEPVLQAAGVRPRFADGQLREHVQPFGPRPRCSVGRGELVEGRIVHHRAVGFAHVAAEPVENREAANG